MPEKSKHLYSFGPFQLNPADCVLSCNGQEIQLEPRAFDVLVFFATHPGELVNREQLKLGVWGTSNLDDNNVDQKIAAVRRVLFQNDGSREYIQNRRGRGWRFVADVTEQMEIPSEETSPAVVMTPAPARSHSALLAGIAVLAGLPAIAAVLLLAARDSSTSAFQPRAVQYRRLTTDGKHKDGPLASDGTYVYFSEAKAGTNDGTPAAVPAGGGDVVFPHNPLGPPVMLLSVARNTRDLLYGRFRSAGDSALFVWRRKGGALEAAGPTLEDARISPDGRSIAYSTGADQSYAVVIRDLGDRPNIRRIPTGGILGYPAWSPDGRRIRFPAFDPVAESAVFWEAGRDGGDLHRLPLISTTGSWFGDACWTVDGRYFIYTETSERISRLWIRREIGATRQERPVLLTNTPIRFDSPAAASAGNTVYARGSISKGGLDRYDSQRGGFTPFWEDTPAVDVSFSNDGAWAAYRRPTDDTLWIARSDGSEGRQITQPPLHALQPHWSPDGKRIAFMGQVANQPSRIFVVNASGGLAQTVEPLDSVEQGVPSWSSDGRYLVYGELRYRRSDKDMLIRLIDLNSGKESVLPGSQAKWTPRWSPDGRYIVAVSTDSTSLALFDCAKRRWRTLATAAEISDPVWSLDSRYVHFSALTGENFGHALYRVNVSSGLSERLAPYPDSPILWSGVSPDGSPLVQNSSRIEEIYAIDFK